MDFDTLMNTAVDPDNLKNAYGIVIYITTLYCIDICLEMLILIMQILKLLSWGTYFS